MRYYLILSLVLLSPLTSGATEAYGSSYTYKLKLFNGEGNALINTAITLTIQSENQTIETDSEGFILITVQRYGACPSSKGFFERLFLKDSWTPEAIQLNYNGSSSTIHRNWKRQFRKADKLVECFDFKRGRVVRYSMK
ncbi:MAG: hypothetical protein V4604_09215 [Bacteroidota bacterium]